MTQEMMTLRALLEKSSDADLLREMIGPKSSAASLRCRLRAKMTVRLRLRCSTASFRFPLHPVSTSPTLNRNRDGLRCG